MAKPPVSGHKSTSDNLNYQTWTLRVSIHCDGCKKKVFKVLQNIDGVYKTVIDSHQNKVTITGSVNGDTLVQKLLKANKHAEILPESFEATAAVDNASGGSKKKKKQSNKLKDGDQGDGVDDEDKLVDDGKMDSEAAMADGNDAGKDQVKPQPTVADGNGGGGGGGKKKKKKKGKGENNTPPNLESEGAATRNAPADTGSAPATTENMEQLNLSHPRHQMVYATPYDQPPYHSFYPEPAYGVSYSTSYPTAESSYYAPPVYGYAQSAYYPVQPAPPSYFRSAFDDHDDENGKDDRRGCTIM